MPRESNVYFNFFHSVRYIVEIRIWCQISINMAEHILINERFFI